MEILLTLLSAAFIGLLVATVFTFSLALVAVFAGVAVASLAFVLLRDKLRHWGVMRQPRGERESPTVIEGQYTEIHIEREDKP